MDVNTFLEKKAELQKVLADNSNKFIQEAFQDFFDDNPWCGAVNWVQYAPGFNDGDPCVFSVHDPNFFVGKCEQAEDFGSQESEDGWYSTWDLRSHNKCESWYKPLEENWESQRDAIGDKATNWASEVFCPLEDIVESLGDSVSVTAIRQDDGVKVIVEEYDCGY